MGVMQAQLDFIGSPPQEEIEQEQFTLWDEKETRAGDFMPLLPLLSKKAYSPSYKQGGSWQGQHPIDYSKVNELFNSFDSKEVERYKSYWESISALAIRFYVRPYKLGIQRERL